MSQKISIDFTPRINKGGEIVENDKLTRKIKEFVLTGLLNIFEELDSKIIDLIEVVKVDFTVACPDDMPQIWIKVYISSPFSSKEKIETTDVMVPKYADGKNPYNPVHISGVVCKHIKKSLGKEILRVENDCKKLSKLYQ